jgi:hypothetical protein
MRRECKKKKRILITGSRYKWGKSFLTSFVGAQRAWPLHATARISLPSNSGQETGNTDYCCLSIQIDDYLTKAEEVNTSRKGREGKGGCESKGRERKGGCSTPGGT